jgi:uncharacterized damage-inducible protein DinB
MHLLEKMAEYTRWADRRMMSLVNGLTNEEFERDLHSTGGSLKKRYVHLAQDTWEWYQDWMGAEPEEEPDFEEMSRQELAKCIEEYQDRFYALVETRAVDSLRMNSGDEAFSISLEEILFHITNHATYHRGQMALGLKMLGKDVLMTDYVPYLRDIAESGN